MTLPVRFPVNRPGRNEERLPASSRSALLHQGELVAVLEGRFKNFR
jgi:hypothetical protein